MIPAERSARLYTALPCAWMRTPSPRWAPVPVNPCHHTCVPTGTDTGDAAASGARTLLRGIASGSRKPRRWRRRDTPGSCSKRPAGPTGRTTQRRTVGLSSTTVIERPSRPGRARDNARRSTPSASALWPGATAAGFGNFLSGVDKRIRAFVLVDLNNEDVTTWSAAEQRDLKAQGVKSRALCGPDINLRTRSLLLP